MKKKIMFLPMLFLLFISLKCYASPEYVFTDVSSEHTTYDSTYWSRPDYYSMLAAAQVASDPSYNPSMSPVYVSGGPVNTDSNLYYVSGWGNTYPNLFVRVFSSPAYPSPGSAWEGQTYTFTFTVDSTPVISTHTIYKNELKEISSPTTVSYDPATRKVTWTGADPLTDIFTIRIFPLDSNGNPDVFNLIWSSGYISKDTTSFVLPKWGPPGYYALRFESRDYREGSAGNPGQHLNRSVYYTKIFNPGYAQQWAKTFEHWDCDEARCIQQTADGGYIVAGNTGLCSPPYTRDDIWILKLDTNGNVLWQKTYGGTDYDEANSIQQTTDGGYIVTGRTRSFGAGSADIWILKLDGDGNILWQKTYGGTSWDQASSIQQTTDGGYIVGGDTHSFGAGYKNIWVLKLDGDGHPLWQKTYGSSGDEIARCVQQTTDGGYIVAGETRQSQAGSYEPIDMLVLKLDRNGNVLWQKTYGETSSLDDALGQTVRQTADGGYIVASGTCSSGGGSDDIWILKLDGDGKVLWQKAYGGTRFGHAYSIQETTDNSYIVAGETYSFGAGSDDIWILKLDGSGNILWEKTYGGTDFDMAYSIQQTIDSGYVVAGKTSSFSANSGFLILKLDSKGDIPGCPLEGASNATVVDVSQTATNTSLAVTNTTITGMVTAVTPVDTDATTSQICYSSESCEGDSDGDGDCDGMDLTILAVEMGNTNCHDDCVCDYNNDGKVDTLDLKIFATDLGRTNCP